MGSSRQRDTHAFPGSRVDKIALWREVPCQDRAQEEKGRIGPVESDHRLVQKWDKALEKIVYPAIGRMPDSKAWLVLLQPLLIRAIPEPPDYNAWRSDPRNTATVIVSILPGHPYSEYREAEGEVERLLLERYKLRAREATCFFLPSVMDDWGGFD